MYQKLMFLSLLMLCYINYVKSCKITATLHNMRKETAWAQITYHHGGKSQIYELKPNQKLAVIIEGTMCNTKPTTITAWNKSPSSDVKFHQSTAFLEGFGKVEYLLTSDPNRGVLMSMREAVLCGFGDCGPRG